MADEFVWMRHSEHGGVAPIPAAAREAWERLGWAECDAPVDPDPVMVEHVPLAVSLAEQAAADAAIPQASSDSEEPTTRKRGRGVTRG